MDEKKTYYEIICAAWDVLKNHYQDPQWESLPDKCVEITNRYKGTRYFSFACDILADVCTEINRRDSE